MSTEETRFNVMCVNCDSVFQPLPETRLWWKAKKRAEKYLDALPINGEECGCVKKTIHPDAPYRVFGYDDELHDFDAPFESFTKAVGAYRKVAQDPFVTVFIKGVSQVVEERLRFV